MKPKFNDIDWERAAHVDPHIVYYHLSVEYGLLKEYMREIEVGSKKDANGHVMEYEPKLHLRVAKRMWAKFVRENSDSEWDSESL